MLPASLPADRERRSFRIRYLYVEKQGSNRKMNPRKISVMTTHEDSRIEALEESSRDQEARLRKIELWQSFVLGATAAFWVFVSLVAWWLAQK